MLCKNHVGDPHQRFRLGRHRAARRRAGSSPTVLIIGGRGKGKSTVAREVMRSLQRVSSGSFSGTEGSNPFYSDMVPPLFTFDTFDRAVLHQIIEQQKSAETPRDVFVLLDDMMYDSSFLRQPIMRSIFLNGRHYRITLVITTQYAIDVPPALRSNVDYVFLMRESNVQTQQKLYRNRRRAPAPRSVLRGAEGARRTSAPW